MRAQASALYYLVVNLIGLTAGPTGIALFTDRVFHADAMVRYSVFCVALIAGAVSIALLLYNVRQYRLAFAEAQAWLRPAAQLQAPQVAGDERSVIGREV
jgi:hypothetical protein